MLFDDLEQKEQLIGLLDDVRDAEGVRIFIGAETRLFSLSGSAVIAAPYMSGRQKVLGAIGVIGPARLNYARVIPLVDYTARALGRIDGRMRRPRMTDDETPDGGPDTDDGPPNRRRRQADELEALRAEVAALKDQVLRYRRRGREHPAPGRARGQRRARLRDPEVRPRPAGRRRQPAARPAARADRRRRPAGQEPRHRPGDDREGAAGAPSSATG